MPPLPRTPAKLLELAEQLRTIAETSATSDVHALECLDTAARLEALADGRLAGATPRR